MKLYITSLVFSFYCLAGISQPNLKFLVPLKQSFDTIYAGQRVYKELPFINTGDDTLKINQITSHNSSCIGGFHKKHIPPGDTSKIILECAYTDMRQGQRTYSWTMFSNTVNPATIIQLVGYIRPSSEREKYYIRLIEGLKYLRANPCLDDSVKIDFTSDTTYMQILHCGKPIIPFLIEVLDNPQEVKSHPPMTTSELIHGILKSVLEFPNELKPHCRKCRVGMCSGHLNNIEDLKIYKQNLKKWYRKNHNKLEWVTTDFSHHSPRDCSGKPILSGYYKVKDEK